MEDNADLVDYIKDVRMLIADSIDTLLELEYDATSEYEDRIVPVNSVVDLVDMSLDVNYSEKLKRAESELMKRQPL